MNKNIYQWYSEKFRKSIPSMVYSVENYILVLLDCDSQQQKC